MNLSDKIKNNFSNFIKDQKNLSQFYLRRNMKPEIKKEPYFNLFDIVCCRKAKKDHNKIINRFYNDKICDWVYDIQSKNDTIKTGLLEKEIIKL